jgi:hypothetical protein
MSKPNQCLQGEKEEEEENRKGNACIAGYT